jgi:hypothetical protein
VAADLQGCNTEVRMMNYRLQLSPISSTQDSNLDVPSRESEEGPATRWEDANFFRSWFIYDSDLDSVPTKSRIRWGVVLGLALAVVVSVTFWVGFGLMIASRWK